MAASRTSVLAALLALAGFAVWAGYAAWQPLSGRAGLQEAWDVAGYWRLGLPALLATQACAGAALRLPLWMQPLCTLAGHSLAMMVFARAGTDLALVPLTVLFVGLPLYAALLVAAFAGRFVRGAVAA